MNETNLPLPDKRCLSKKEAAYYLGIGLTLLAELHIPSIKLGRRLVYDKVDLDSWLEEYKQRERRLVGKDVAWTNKPHEESTEELIQTSGGSIQRSLTASDYAKALGLRTNSKQKHYSPK